MIPFIQTKVVVKNSAGEQIVNGNCYPTAVACIIEMPPTDVPNIETLWCVDTGFAYSVMHKWLNQQGYNLREYVVEYSVFHEGSEKIRDTNNETYLTELSEDIKAKLREELKDKLYMVSGKSPRGIYHICIYKNGKMVHDPHPTGEGIVTEEYFEVIEKKAL